MLQEELLEMLVGGIHVVMYFVIVVYSHLFRWKELRDLSQDELLEMLVGVIHIVVYFVTIVHLHLYFASHQRILLDHWLSFVVVGFYQLQSNHTIWIYFFLVLLHWPLYISYKDVFVTLITLFIADAFIFFSEDHKGAFFVNSNENEIVRKMGNITSIVELLSYETTV